MRMIDKIADFVRPRTRGKSEVRQDASVASFWSNELTGLGGSGTDKTTWHAPGAVTPLPSATLAALWLSDPIAKTVVEAIVDDGLKEGFSIRYNGKDPEQRNLMGRVSEATKRLGVEGHIRLAAKTARALGGGAILIVQGQGHMVDRLITADARDLIPLAWDLDTPETYTWAHASVPAPEGAHQVSSSDLVVLPGSDTPLRDRRDYWAGWYKPVLQHVWEVIRDFRSSWQSSVAMIADGSQAILKLPGLAHLVASGGRGALLETLAQIQIRRWVGKIMPIDATESYEVISRSYAGIADILKANQPLVAQAADMPITRLFGVSPGGLGSNGQGEQKNWLSSVQAWRRTHIEPALMELIRKIAADEGVREARDWGVEWPSLEVLSAVERAEIESKETNTDALRVSLGVPKNTITMHRYGGPEYQHSPPILSDEDREQIEDPAEAAGPVDPKAAFTGVQTAEMRQTLMAVAAGHIPRESGVESLLVSLPIDRAQADRLMGNIGKNFVPSGMGQNLPHSLPM